MIVLETLVTKQALLVNVDTEYKQRLDNLMGVLNTTPMDYNEQFNAYNVSKTKL